MIGHVKKLQKIVTYSLLKNSAHYSENWKNPDKLLSIVGKEQHLCLTPVL